MWGGFSARRAGYHISVFERELAELNPPSKNRRWWYVAYDQLSSEKGPFSHERPSELGIVLVESGAQARRRPYHKQKLALMWANQRHFALEQARRGVAVRYEITSNTIASALGSVLKDTGALRAMEPAERELRIELAPLKDSGDVRFAPNDLWLTDTRDFLEYRDRPPWRMDSFYHKVRRRYDILMESDKPVGGRFSFDTENRRSWRGDPTAPEPPRFRADTITDEVARRVNEDFADHPGEVRPESLPATSRDARRLWKWALDKCLPQFGPYEDAMSLQSSGLFHTRISALMNLGRLTPDAVLRDVLDADIPMQSKEGFVRQILGWREYVRHVHRVTDGFRILPHAEPPVQHTDGGYERWSARPWPVGNEERETARGSALSFLGCERHLPPAWWGAQSGLACLDTVVASVWSEGWSHHITRLMVLANIATLLDVSPRELTDWFWIAYTDAYDWVVEPNVMAMGTFGVGDLMTTKPYLAGANYINKMSDYCSACKFDPDRDCPLTGLYWAFLVRHADRLRSIPRLRAVTGGLPRRTPDQRRRDHRIFERTYDLLWTGERLSPGSFASV